MLYVDTFSRILPRAMNQQMGYISGFAEIWVERKLNSTMNDFLLHGKRELIAIVVDLSVTRTSVAITLL